MGSSKDTMNDRPLNLKTPCIPSIRLAHAIFIFSIQISMYLVRGFWYLAYRPSLTRVSRHGPLVNLLYLNQFINEHESHPLGEITQLFGSILIENKIHGLITCPLYKLPPPCSNEQNVFFSLRGRSHCEYRLSNTEDPSMPVYACSKLLLPRLVLAQRA